MEFLGKSNFQDFGWMHPDDCDFGYLVDGHDVFCFIKEDGIYHFVHIGGEIYDFDNYVIMKTEKVKGINKRWKITMDGN